MVWTLFHLFPFLSLFSSHSLHSSSTFSENKANTLQSRVVVKSIKPKDVKWHQTEIKKLSITDRQTDRRTNRQTDGQSGSESCVHGVTVYHPSKSYCFQICHLAWETGSNYVTIFFFQVACTQQLVRLQFHLYSFKLVRPGSWVPGLCNNKAGYTATPVGYAWVGAVFKVTSSFGQEQWGQRLQKYQRE